MDPGKRPSNDNDGGLPEREPGLFSTRKRAIESTFSLCGIAAFFLVLWFFASPDVWRSIGIGLAVIVVASLAAAIYRRIVYGRA